MSIVYTLALKIRLAVLLGWIDKKLEEHRRTFPEVADNPKEPPQRGIPRTEKKPLSLNRLEAMLLCTLFGKTSKGRKAYALEELIHGLHSDSSLSPMTVAVWRNRSDFKKGVKAARKEYAAFFYERLQTKMPLADYDQLLTELSAYPVELQREILALGPIFTDEDMPEERRVLIACNAGNLRTRAKNERKDPLGKQGKEWIAEQFDQGLERALQLLLDPEALPPEDKVFLAQYIRKQVRKIQGGKETTEKAVRPETPDAAVNLEVPD